METLPTDAFRGTELLRPGRWIVAFVADWCPFCRRFLPEFSALEADKRLQLALGDVTDFESPLWDDFQIDVIPTLVVFRDGHPEFRVDGVLGVGVPRGGLEKARAVSLGSG
jgi:thioredoxin 1